MSKIFGWTPFLSRLYAAVPIRSDVVQKVKSGGSGCGRTRIIFGRKLGKEREMLWGDGDDQEYPRGKLKEE